MPVSSAMVGSSSMRRIPHHHLQVCPGLGERFERLGKNPCLVLDLFSPQRYVLHNNWHDCFSKEMALTPDKADTTRASGAAKRHLRA